MIDAIVFGVAVIAGIDIARIISDGTCSKKTQLAAWTAVYLLFGILCFSFVCSLFK